MRVAVLNGVNLDVIDRRDPELYGGLTLTQLETRIFKVNPNTFQEGLESVGIFPLGSLVQSTTGGGGAGGGGGGLGGGGGGLGGGQGGGIFDIPRVYVAGAGAATEFGQHRLDMVAKGPLLWPFHIAGGIFRIEMRRRKDPQTQSAG